MDKRRAFARPNLRPYLPDLRFVRTVGAGLCVICRGVVAAAQRGGRLVLGDPVKGASTRDELADAVERVGMGVFVVLIAVTSLSGVVMATDFNVLPYLPWVVGVGTLALVGAACVVAPSGTPRRKIVSSGGVAPDAPPAEQETPLDAATVARTVRQLAAAGGWQGAHLDDVLAHLPGRSRTELLTVLADARIEVAQQLKLTLPGGRQRNRQGVRIAALPPGLGEAPPPPATTPSQPAPTPPPEASPRPPHLTVHGAR